MYIFASLPTPVPAPAAPPTRRYLQRRRQAGIIQYNQPRARVLYSVLATLWFGGDATALEGIKPGNGDAIGITADQAWEDTEPDLIHFQGNFEMHSNQWHLTAESAALQGKLDAPDQVVLLGSPAQISLLHDVNGRSETIAASVEANCETICPCWFGGKESMIRSIVCAAEFVWSVAKTKCPVSAAVIAVDIVSGSRISPIMITSGSWRSTARSASWNDLVSCPTSRCEIIALSCEKIYSIGSSMVMI